MVGTDGDIVGGSMKQSEKGRTKGLYSHAFGDQFTDSHRLEQDDESG